MWEVEECVEMMETDAVEKKFDQYYHPSRLKDELDGLSLYVLKNNSVQNQ